MNTLEQLNNAMRDYVARTNRRYPPKPFVLDEAMTAYIRRVRQECRDEEYGGGMCHQVTEILAYEFGIGRLAVSYLSRDGEVICAGHYVNLLSDGSLLDGTADQFGEGHDVRLLRPDDPEYGRIRPEFDIDYTPALYPDELAGWGETWSGEGDWEQQDRLCAARDHGWWVDDPELLLAHYRERLELERRCPYASGASDAARTSAWITSIENRPAVASP